MADTATEARKFSDPQVPKERKLSDTIPMESVQRLAKLPVVESSLNIATDVYSRVKEANSVLNWTLSTAESTVSRAVEHALPVAERLEKPLKRMDTLLCSSLDYVEAKVPAVKLPTQELLETTSSYVEAKLQPALEKAAELKQFGAEKVSAVKNFAMESSNTSQLLRLPALTLMAMARRVMKWPLEELSAQLHPLTKSPVIIVTPSTPLKPNESPLTPRMDTVTPPPCPPPPPPTPSDLRIMVATNNINKSALSTPTSRNEVNAGVELVEVQDFCCDVESELHIQLLQSNDNYVEAATTSFIE
ncbi:hypothetical protein B566_EDAN001716 [Ephemera danica]|nr:hypothetical protein B566_EDAN001716 [Ephemera danica]